MRADADMVRFAGAETVVFPTANETLLANNNHSNLSGIPAITLTLVNACTEPNELFRVEIVKSQKPSHSPCSSVCEHPHRRLEGKQIDQLTVSRTAVTA
jgi:hypothetical protein